MHLPKAQAMAEPTMPPPDTTTSYTVSAEEPAHRRQATSGPPLAASCAVLHQRTQSKPAIEPMRAAIMTRAGVRARDFFLIGPGKYFRSRVFTPVLVQSFLQNRK